ncbi:MAG: hypothetical protein JXP34_12195 [Planctomycetes bacterium]|nr:hypothetical protein [Planctomycetota bacterium]
MEHRCRRRGGSAGLDPEKGPAPGIDENFKILLLRDPRAIARWLFEGPVSNVRTIDPGFSILQTRIADKLILAEFPDGQRTLLHVEFQTAGDPSMGRRMLAYAGLMAQLLGTTAYRRCGFRQVVVYIDPDRRRRDPGEFVLPGRNDCEAWVRYQVIRLWEVDPRVLRRLRSVWIDAFVHLSRVRNVEREVIRSRERIRTSRVPAEDRREALACLCATAGLRIRDRERVLALFRGIDMGESVIIKYWIEQGKAEGLARGKAEGLARGKAEGLARGEARGEARGREEAARLAVMESLRGRFGRVPADVAKRIKAIHDHKRLLHLVRAAAQADTIKEFRATLGTRSA